jgi:hypothetical protein
VALPLVLLAGYASGLFGALIASEPLAKTSFPTRTRYFAATAIFAGMALVPSASVLYALFPDWSLMYLANPAQLPILLMLPVVAGLAFGAPLLGFVVAQRALAARKKKIVRGHLIGSGLLFLVIFSFGWDRLSSIGYYEAYHYGGELVSFGDSAAVVVVMMIVPAIIASFAATQHMVKRHIRGLEQADERPEVAGR